MAALLLLLLAAAGEVALRVVWGLGDPPLYVLDEQVEYLYKPSSSFTRMGNHVRINQWSMRADEFPASKADPRELRILLMGDSILAGGARIDQSDLASAVIGPELARISQRPVVVGNASAGSWGPPNLLAYAERFGFFEADVVVLVLNSNDYDDVPGLEPIGPQWPTRKPVLALQEVAQNYGPRLLARAGLGGRSAPPRTTTHEQDVAHALGALRDLIDLARASGASVVLVQYLKLSELAAARSEGGGGAEAGFSAIRAVAESASVRTIDTSGAFAANGVPRANFFLPGDNVHPSAAGQRAMGALIVGAVVQELGLDRSAAEQPPGRD
ncbi:MAG: SGNH/GDSL hydrolase family protein [Phycisphaeraceae bacterium]|nr:SGNH/GDSL hydrolase family protein [Phycisphaeraceae bacterium]